MNKVFFFILCLFLFFGCARQEEVSTENSQEAQGSAREQAAQGRQTEEAKAPAEKEKTEEPNQDIAKMRNPFLTQEEENTSKETGAIIPINYLNLTAVIYSPQATSKAIIDGQILEVGDTIDSKQIIKIEPGTVVLKDTKGEYIIRLKQITGK